MRDIRFAFRTISKTPFVPAVAVLSLALGIGANAAIYSLFDQILLRPLPVAAPDELVNLSMPGPIRGSDSCNQSSGCDVIFSYPMFRDIEREQDVLSGFAGHRIYGVSIAIDDEPTTGKELSLPEAISRRSVCSPHSAGSSRRPTTSPAPTT